MSSVHRKRRAVAAVAATLTLAGGAAFDAAEGAAAGRTGSPWTA